MNTETLGELGRERNNRTHYRSISAITLAIDTENKTLRHFLSGHLQENSQ